MNAPYKRFVEFGRVDDGPTGTEYAVLLGLIAVAVIGALATFGERMDNLYTSISSTLSVF